MGRPTRDFLKQKLTPVHMCNSRAQPIARPGEHFRCLDLNFLVGNRRENTFALHAREPRAPCDCDTHAQKRKRVLAYTCVHARAAHTGALSSAARAEEISHFSYIYNDFNREDTSQRTRKTGRRRRPSLIAHRHSRQLHRPVARHTLLDHQVLLDFLVANRLENTFAALPV